MRKILLISILGLLLAGCSKVAEINPASDELFIRYYGNADQSGTMTDAGSMVVNESEIVVAGTIFNGENFTRDIYLFKTDLIGKIITENRIEFNTDKVLDDYGRDIKVDPNGGYYILGERDTLADEKDLVLLKVSNNLEKLWMKKLRPLGANKSENARALCVQEDGGLAILGEYLDDSGTLRSFLYVFYPDTPGQSWVKDYGNSGKDFNAGKSLMQRETLGYSFPGTGNNFGDTDNSQATLILTDDTGLPEEPVPFGEENIGVDLLKFGGEYVMLSNNYDADAVPDSVSVFRIDGEDLSAYREEKIGPENLEGRSIASTPDGYIITGAVISGSESDICLIKTDHNIKPLWQDDSQPAYKSYGGDGEDYGVKVAALDEGYIILGISQVAGLRMITLIRTDLEGNLITN
ncbi:hypothetical protein ACFLU5_05675 [Bacteroidota bacterium]